MDSDNPVGAENQQERLIRTGWVIGFVDGEGCFSIGFVKQPDRATRRGYRTGYQVTHRFVVVQGASSVRFIVSARDELLEVIIPFFREHPLRTAKRMDFEKFARCVDVCATGRHLTVPGLIEIAEIAETMN